MAYIDTLKDGNGEIVYPITSAEAIFDAQGGETVQDKIDDLSSEVSTKADTASPSFTGVPTAPTAAVGTNTTQVATTEFVQAALPDVSGFASKVSPNFTGIPTAPTAAPGTSTTQIATTAFVNSLITGIDSKVQSGVTAATTAASGIVNFPVPYTEIPNVVVTGIIDSTTAPVAWIKSITKSSFTYGKGNGNHSIQWIASGPVDTTGKTLITKYFRANQTWTVPSEVTKVDLYLVGGGYDGKTPTADDTYGGDGGKIRFIKNCAVTPGQSINITIGAANGGDSSFGSYSSSSGVSNKASTSDDTSPITTIPSICICPLDNKVYGLPGCRGGASGTRHIQDDGSYISDYSGGSYNVPMYNVVQPGGGASPGGMSASGGASASSPGQTAYRTGVGEDRTYYSGKGGNAAPNTGHGGGGGGKRPQYGNAGAGGTGGTGIVIAQYFGYE